ncbi:hypothetical protein B0H17DRAFT_1130184 [Mycena rosella]|uniref:Uncharacterized protein n=1 Tax=Mycena rosella TaxID=1033263 RepID=A0AAD7DRA7_MYCRO|nr:hypothetical protein B0H17DRAFT_1130184 [Mycena rosella]
MANNSIPTAPTALGHASDGAPNPLSVPPLTPVAQSQDGVAKGPTPLTAILTEILSQGSTEDLGLNDLFDSDHDTGKDCHQPMPGPSSCPDAGECTRFTPSLKKQLTTFLLQTDVTMTQPRFWMVLLAEHGVAEATWNPIFLSLALANDPHIQQLTNRPNQAITSTIAANARFDQLEQSIMSADECLARLQSSALELQHKMLDRLDHLEVRTRSTTQTAAPTPAPISALPPYSRPTSTTSMVVAPTPVPAPALPAVSLVAPSAYSTEGRVMRMDRMLEQFTTQLKRACSPSPTGDVCAVRPYRESASVLPPLLCHCSGHRRRPHPDRSHCRTSGCLSLRFQHHASRDHPAISYSAPLPPGIASGMLQEQSTAPLLRCWGSYKSPIFLTPPVQVPYIATVAPLAIFYTPVVSNTAPPPPGITHTPSTSHGAGCARSRLPPAPRNPAAEAYLGPWDWKQDITNQAGAMMRNVLSGHNLHEAFKRAHRYGQQYVVCAFKTEAQAAWFIQAFNASCVHPYENVFASAFPK